MSVCVFAKTLQCFLLVSSYPFYVNLLLSQTGGKAVLQRFDAVNEETKDQFV